MTNWFFSGNGAADGDATTQATACSDLSQAETLGVIAGDVILLERGTTLILASTWQPALSNIIIDVYGSGELPFIQGSFTSINGLIYLLDVSNWTFRHVKMGGVSGAYGQLVFGKGNTVSASGLTVYGCEIDGTSENSLSSKRTGIYVGHEDYPVASSAVELSDIDISETEVYNTGYQGGVATGKENDGILIHHAVSGIKVYRNNVHDCGGNPIDIAGGLNIWCYRNNCHDNVTGIKIHSQSYQAENVYYFGNKIWNNDTEGSQLVNIKNLFLAFNTFHVADGQSVIGIEDYPLALDITGITEGNPTVFTVGSNLDIDYDLPVTFTGITQTSGDTLEISGGTDVGAGGYRFNFKRLSATTFTVVDRDTDIALDTSGRTYSLSSAKAGFRYDGLGNFITYERGSGVICCNYLLGSSTVGANNQGLINFRGTNFDHIAANYSFGGNYYESTVEHASLRIISDAYRTPIAAIATGATTTITTEGNHGITDQDHIEISGVTTDGNAINGTNILATVTGATTFTIGVDSTGATIDFWQGYVDGTRDYFNSVANKKSLTDWNAAIAGTDYFNDGFSGRADTQFTDEANGDFTINASSVLYDAGYYGWGSCTELLTYFDGNVPHPDLIDIGCHGVRKSRGKKSSDVTNITVDNGMKSIKSTGGIKYIEMLP